MPILQTVTLGCKVNQYETQYAREGFLRLGYREAINGEPADLILVNTCTVTAESEAKSRKIIRRLAKKNPRAEIIVMGCYATRAPDEAASLPGVSEVIRHKCDLPDFLACRGLVDIPSGISTFQGRHRAWVKIQDGCREKCSYCIVPLVRPVLASRPVDDVLDEIRRLTSAGFAELVLTGIHLGHYGVDFKRAIQFLPSPGTNGYRAEHGRLVGRGAGGEGASCATTNLRSVPGLLSNVESTVGLAARGARARSNTTPLTLAHSQRERELDERTPGLDLAGLLRRIIALKGEFRVRLSSIEAAEVTPELLDVMAEHPQRICPHLHLPMQSGSDRILKQMRRRWPVRQFIDRCHEIRARLDQPALTTDIIVGFPGETEEDFSATCRAAEEIGFSKIHVFRYSPRPGTEAASMPNRVPQRIHRLWAAELAELGNRLTDQYLQSLRGKTLQVLVEGEMGTGPICRHGPEGTSYKLDLSPFPTLLGTADRYVTVELAGQAELIGRMIVVDAGKPCSGRLMSRRTPG